MPRFADKGKRGTTCPFRTFAPSQGGDFQRQQHSRHSNVAVSRPPRIPHESTAYGLDHMAAAIQPNSMGNFDKNFCPFFLKLHETLQVGNIASWTNETAEARRDILCQPSRRAFCSTVD